MLRKIDESIWVAEQPLRYLGLSIGTRMTVIQLANLELVVISPIQMSDELVTHLNELGTVKHIIAPNLYHYLFASNFKLLYPNATFWSVPELDLKKPDLPIDQEIREGANNEWDDLECIFLDGFRTLGLGGFDSLNECVFFHTVSRTLILTDAAIHIDDAFPLITQLATRVIGGYKSLSPSLLERIATTEKGNVRRSVEKILDWDFDRVIMAHGSIIEQHGKEQFRQGYERFLGQSINIDRRNPLL
jgi:Domain of unknown function (DUF4336)